ncbi:MAG: prolipoprotein diacylglyceryl transferase [Gemmatimonadaceae bacterium]
MPTDPIIHQPFTVAFGPVQLTGFGIAVLLGFVIGQIIGQRVLHARGHDPAPIVDIVFASVIGFLIGAKIYYALLMGDYHALFSRGGFVFWGGLIGGIGAALFVIKRKGLSFMRIADVGGIGIAAGYSIGRTGCWAIGDDYGRLYDGPFAVSFPNGAPPSTAANMHAMFGIPIPPGMAPNTVLSVYPTQLFEVVLGFVMFGILWRLRNHKHAEGWLFGVYMVMAGVERFIVEFFRAKDDRFFGPLTSAQVVALGFVVAGVIWMRARDRVRAGAPGVAAARLERHPLV